MAAGTVTLKGTLVDPAGLAQASAKVEAFRLQDKATASALSAAGVGSADSFKATSNASGIFSISCTHQTAHVAPLTYKLVFPDNRYAIVPVPVADNDTTVDLGTIVIYDNPVSQNEINITPLIARNMAGISSALGTSPVSTVAIKEYGDGRDKTTELTLTNFIVGALAGAGAALGLGNIVYAFPAGQQFLLVSSFSNLSLTAAGTAVATDTGLGSVIASGAVSVLSGTGTFEDRLTGQTINTASGGGAAVNAVAAPTAGIGLGQAISLAAGVKNVFLNSAGTWNADNTGNLTASGVIVLKWTKM